MHLVTLARVHSASGFGAYAGDIFCDAGRRILFHEWRDFSTRWAALLQ